jgi:hypothetical protein
MDREEKFKNMKNENNGLTGRGRRQAAVEAENLHKKLIEERDGVHKKPKYPGGCNTPHNKTNDSCKDYELKEHERSSKGAHKDLCTEENIDKNNEIIRGLESSDLQRLQANEKKEIIEMIGLNQTATNALYAQIGIINKQLELMFKLTVDNQNVIEYLKDKVSKLQLINEKILYELKEMKNEKLAFNNQNNIDVNSNLIGVKPKKTKKENDPILRNEAIEADILKNRQAYEKYGIEEDDQRRVKTIRKEVETKNMRNRREVITNLSEEQCVLITRGKSPVIREKIKLIYFEGIKRNLTAFTKAVLKKSGMSGGDTINISWIGNNILELFVPLSKVIKMKQICAALGGVHMQDFNPISYDVASGIYESRGEKENPLNRFKTRIERQLKKNQRCMQGGPIGILKLLMKCNVETIDMFLKPETYNKELIDDSNNKVFDLIVGEVPI